MSGAGGSAEGNGEEVSPFPAAYGSVGGSQPETGSGPTPSPSPGKTSDGSRDPSAGRSARRSPPRSDPRPPRSDPGPSRSEPQPEPRPAGDAADRPRPRPARDRRLSRPDPAAVSTGPIQVVAAGVGPNLPVSRGVAPTPSPSPAPSPSPSPSPAPERAATGRSAAGRSSRSSAGSTSGPGSRPSAGGSQARASTTRTAVAEPTAVNRPAAPTASNGALGESWRAAPGTAVPDTVAMQVAREYAPDAELRMGEHHWWQRRRKVTVVRSRSARRLVRRLDTWTVFKVSLIFYLLCLVIVLIAGIVAWRVAGQVGFITDIQKGVRSLADDRSFKLHGGVVFRYSLLGGAALAVAGTILNVVAAMLYNLISDIIGGIQVIVVTEPD